MKFLVILSVLMLSLTAFGAENMASDCTRTLHSEDRENTKADNSVRPKESSSQGAVSQ
jgi:hypothetical protein